MLTIIWIVAELYHFVVCQYPAWSRCFDSYCRNIVNMRSLFWNDTSFESELPWLRYVPRKLRMFDADVLQNAPKERTLFNYRVQVNNKNIHNQNNLNNVDNNNNHYKNVTNVYQCYNNLYRTDGRRFEISWVFQMMVNLLSRTKIRARIRRIM